MWGKNVATGNLIPLDPAAPVYKATGQGDSSQEGMMMVERQHGLFVSHFALCTKVEKVKRPKGAVNVPRGNGAGPNGTGKPEGG